MNRKQYLKNWKQKNRDKVNKYQRAYYAKARRKALELICGKDVKCKRCGEDNYNLLEINHINGGGTREHKRKGGYVFIGNIVNGKRKINDLEVLCKACNYLHLAEMLSGKKYREVKDGS